jgi:hypothetical protein
MLKFEMREFGFVVNRVHGRSIFFNVTYFAKMSVSRMKNIKWQEEKYRVYTMKRFNLSYSVSEIKCLDLGDILE